MCGAVGEGAFNNVHVAQILEDACFHIEALSVVIPRQHSLRGSTDDGAVVV